MDTTLQEIIYQVMLLVITGTLTLIGAYVKKLIETKIDVTKYGFENERVERIIDNAVHYAEQKGKSISSKNAKILAGNKKLDFARGYINKVDKGIITKYGNDLDAMIERKVAQNFGIK